MQNSIFINSKIVKVLISVGAFVCYGLFFVSLHSKIGDIVASLALVPIIVVAWLWGSVAAGLSICVIILLTPLLSTAVGKEPFFLFHTPANQVGTLMLVFVGLVVGHLQHMNGVLTKEIAKRKELEQLLEQKNTLYDKLLTENKKFKKRYSTEFESQVNTLKSQLKDF